MLKNKDAVEYITFESDPSIAIFGSTDKHIVGDATKLSEYFEESSIDIILLNGVLGWGGKEKYQTPEDARKNDLTLQVMLESYNVLKNDGILLLGRNSRHYFPSLSKIIPLFYPISLSSNKIPVKRSFMHEYQSDHFYDTLQKSNTEECGEDCSNEGRHVFNIDYSIVEYNILKRTMCSVNHLIIANRAMDVLLFGGRQILKTSGCWVIILLSNDSIMETTAAISGLGFHSGARIMFLNSKNGIQDINPPCHTNECIPVIRDEERLDTLSKILKDKRWNTVITHNMYGENGDPQKIWIFETVTRILKSSTDAMDKLYVFMYSKEKTGVYDVHINAQYQEMISAFNLPLGIDLLNESYNLDWNAIDVSNFQIQKYDSMKEKGTEAIENCVALIGGVSPLQESMCKNNIDRNK
eukprot:g7663.t1